MLACALTAWRAAQILQIWSRPDDTVVTNLVDGRGASRRRRRVRRLVAGVISI